jgi:purine-binding chemotaxis protein CheW
LAKNVPHDGALNMSSTKQLCTFLLDDKLFGVAVDRVREVLRYQEMARIPLSPSVVTGLMNLRGQIVTAIDLRRRLGLQERPASSFPVNVIVQSDDAAVSLLVDEIGDVIEVTDDTFESPPDLLDGVSRELISGVHKLPDRLLMLLNVDRAIDVAPAA